MGLLVLVLANTTVLRTLHPTTTTTTTTTNYNYKLPKVVVRANSPQIVDEDLGDIDVGSAVDQPHIWFSSSVGEQRTSTIVYTVHLTTTPCSRYI